MLTFVISNEAAMLAFGAKLAHCCQPGSILFLYGELGMGKTTLVRGFLRGLGYQEKVKSPTYNLVETYDIGDQHVCHFDLYRLADPQELESIGIRDYFDSEAIVLIEWPERGHGILPTADLSCYIHALSLGREVRLAANSVAGTIILDKLEANII